MFVDLHLHTLYSDGKLSVKKTLDVACKKNLGLVSITDHDTIKGVREAIQYSWMKGITCISGLELSCRNDKPSLIFPQDVSIHVLGYNIDYSCLELQNYLCNYHAKRKNILLELISELVYNGLEISYEDIDVIAGEQMRIQDVIRHINSCLMCDEKKERYIDIAMKYYPILFSIDSPLQTAVELIKKAGGKSVLAHAFFSYRDYDIETNSYLSVKNLLDYLCDLGIDGIETFYPKYTIEQNKFLQEEAERRKLFVTAGSDFHGTPLRKGMMDFYIDQMQKTSEMLLDINRYKKQYN